VLSYFQVRALASTSVAKAAAVALLGPCLVPSLPCSEGFLEHEGSLAVVAAARGSVPVLAIGGYDSLAGVERALAQGFAGVQMARALIRDPTLVMRFRAAAGSAAPAAAGTDAAAEMIEVRASKEGSATRSCGTTALPVSVAPDSSGGSHQEWMESCVSHCVRCNMCVLSALSRDFPARCVLRPPALPVESQETTASVKSGMVEKDCRVVTLAFDDAVTSHNGLAQDR
jgi:hypothetical protein